MAQQAYQLDPVRRSEAAEIRSTLQPKLARSGSILARYEPLILLALVVDLLTPSLIFWGILPPPVRWISHAAIALMILAAYARMMVAGWVPRVVLLIVAISLIGVTVALLEGQGLIPTAWGWWIMFQYPIVGLFAYFSSRWPEQFPQKLRQACVAILGMQLVVQVGQYLTGQAPGDDLAGTFGRHGVGPLATFILFVVCLAFGRWLASGNWKTLVVVLAMGAGSSALGAIKIFPFAVAGLGMMALLIYLARGGNLVKPIPVAALVGGMFLVSMNIYNSVVPSAQRKPIERFFQLENLTEYLDRVELGSGEGSYYRRYHLGRNFALKYGWDVIQRDAATFLFGMGLGARGESRTLGTAGEGLLQGPHGRTAGTSLLVLLQELGMMGQIVFAGFISVTAFYLFQGTRKNPESDVNELRYALLLFTLLWPLWLWYTNVLTHRVLMLLYWVALGYTLGLDKWNPGNRILPNWKESRI